MLDLWRSVASTTVARMYSLIITMFLVMVVARWLGPTGQGAVAAAGAWATLFGTLASLSLGQVALHRATVRRAEPWMSEALGTLLILAIVVTVLAWAIAFAAYVFTSGRAFKNIAPLPLFVAFLVVPFVVWEFYGTSLLLASDQLSLYNKALLIGRTAALVMMFACWKARLGVVAAILVSVISQAITAVTGLHRLWEVAGRRVRATIVEARALLSGGVSLHLNTISGTLIASVGVLVVNNFRGSMETGLYQFATALMNVVTVIPLAASQVLSSQVAQVGPDHAWRTQRKVMVYLPLGMIIVALVAAVCAPYAVPLVVGVRYRPAVPVFQLLLFGLLGATFSAVMVSQWIGRGYFLPLSLLSAGVAVVHLTASLILVPRYGMYGAVYATLMTQTIAVLFNGFFAIRCEMSFRRMERASESAYGDATD